MPADTAGLWDLTPLYAGPDDPAISADLDRLVALGATFRRNWRGRLQQPTLTAIELASALADHAALQRCGLKPYFYAQLLFAGDCRDDRHKALAARTRELWGEVAEQTLFAELELLRLDADHFDRLLADPRVAACGHYLRQLRAQAPYTLSEEVEQALKRKDLAGKEGFAQLFEEITSGLTFPFVFPGEEQPRDATGEELLALLYHPDALVRERAFATFLDGHAAQATVLTACFNNLLLDHGKEAELRRYPDLMTPAHLSSETDPAMVEQMMAVTEANYPLAQEYFALKRRLLGLDKLKNTDLYAPLANTTRSFTLEEGRTLVLEAFAGFSPQLASQAASFFDQARIDLFPRPGKSGGAFCHGMEPGLPPYILTNYTGTLRDVSTLAHELGHGVHFLASRQQNFYHYNAPLPLAETASVFGEMLLARHLLAHEADRTVKIALLCAKLEEIIATTFRQNVLTRFELAAHQARAVGLLASDDFGRLWWEENAKLFGAEVEMIPAYRWGWSYIGHFIHSRFYCYSYVFGELVVLALYHRYRQEGEAFVPKYLELLASGGSAPPAELLRPFGIDLADPAFWQGGYDIVRELLEELRGLVDAE